MGLAEMIDSVGIEQGRSPFDAVDFISFVQKEFCEVCPVLAGYACYECFFSHDLLLIVF